MKTKHLLMTILYLACFTLGSCDKKSNEVTNPDTPESSEKIAGMLPGKFSIGENRKIQFSQGNLQYLGETKTWRFAEHQFDCLGTANNYISEDNIDWIDLFVWGTGNNPTNSSKSYSDYSIFTDWGVNQISNGGNKENL